jgi:hypothetical protein
MEGFLICLSVVSVLVVIFAFILTMRYLVYRETLFLAEKGLVRPERPRRDGKDTLRWGIVIAAIGLALCLGMWPLGMSSGGPSYPLGLGPWMLFGLVPLFFGLALIAIYLFTRESRKPEE